MKCSENKYKNVHLKSKTDTGPIWRGKSGGHAVSPFESSEESDSGGLTMMQTTEMSGL